MTPNISSRYRNDLPEIERLVAGLRLPASAVLPLYELAQHPPLDEVRLPGPAETGELLARLNLPAADRADLADARPDPRATPELWWLLERCVTLLRERQGTVGPLTPWPDLPDELGPVGRYLYVWVFLTAAADAREFHRCHDISDDHSWAALGALATQLDNRRALHGQGGLRTQNWVTHHYRGAIFVLGRLHFERTMITFDPGPAGGAPRIGAPALGVHIPEGRLTPDSCDDALDRATRFFAAHFPDVPYRYATCSSWVLDPQLKEYLAPDSNIIRFQERFTLTPDTGPDSNPTVVEFIFKRPIADLDQLPRDTSLARGIADHIRSGRAWHFRTGWFELAP